MAQSPKTKSNALNGSPKAQDISAVPPEGISRAELEEKVGGLVAYADASSNPLVDSPQVPARKKILVGSTGIETTLFVSSGAMGHVLFCLKVDQSTVAIRETFGKFFDVLKPGCHFLPWVCWPTSSCGTKTKDNVFVAVVASIQYRALAEKASNAFNRLSKMREQIQVHECFPFLIVLSWKGSAPEAQGGAAENQSTIVFPKGNPIPTIKALTFFRSNHSLLT
ncbi:uncharacterized protein A4U43_C04F24020 [Asparagus officinalis]|uniref:Uncharacterized protein n=1 Tax=Asparagus officinalis TaxID=4686 RepID=A0A5P1F8L3_ASPOF|nr:uncharacterized protein A4U43_C04F24020 [Asparagus officinalis]